MATDVTDNIIDNIDGLLKFLKEEVPDKEEIKFKDEILDENRINEHNKAIINQYLEGETEHLKQQKPVGIIIALAVAIQLIVFNTIIYKITLYPHEDVEIFKTLLDFLKYYIGAVIVELLGMCFFIVKGIYSKSIDKIAEHIVKK